MFLLFATSQSSGFAFRTKIESRQYNRNVPPLLRDVLPRTLEVYAIFSIIQSYTEVN